jgi:hypothetical protein
MRVQTLFVVTCGEPASIDVAAFRFSEQVSLKDFVNSQLTSCQTQLGLLGFQQLLATVEPDVMTQLKHFLQ